MNKIVAGFLLVFGLSIFGTISCGFIAPNGDGKHTGPVTVRDVRGNTFELLRPNQELFEMVFTPGETAPNFRVGTRLADVVYSDERGHRFFFIKALLLDEPPAPPPADKILYGSLSGYNWTCYSGTSQCVANVAADSGDKYYLWKDGGYRAKPETK